MHDGKVCVLDMGYLGRGIVPVDERGYGWNLFFVHPETGLLEPTPQVSKRARLGRQPRPPLKHRWISKNVAVQQIRGLWFECHFEVVPEGVRFKAYDHALERVVSRGELTRQDTQYLICTLKRQLSRRELRRVGLRNASVPYSTGAQSSGGHTCGRLKSALQVSAGRRSWVIGHCRLAVQIRLRVSTRVAQFAERQCNIQIASCPLVFQISDGPKLWVIVCCWFESNRRLDKPA
jgi:hypothetical protein